MDTVATSNGHGLEDAEHRVPGALIDVELGLRVAACLFFENKRAYDLVPV
jgi:hypothetical protein